VILVETTGSHDAQTIRALARGVLGEAIVQSSHRVLLDVTAATGHFETMEIYYCPRELKTLGLPMTAEVAVVFGRQHPDHQFFENVCRNQSLDLAVFYDREVALAWFSNGR